MGSDNSIVRVAAQKTSQAISARPCAARSRLSQRPAAASSLPSSSTTSLTTALLRKYTMLMVSDAARSHSGSMSRCCAESPENETGGYGRPKASQADKRDIVLFSERLSGVSPEHRLALAGAV